VTLTRNLVVGLTNSIYSALIGLAVVPFYLKYLGIEAYGLIGFSVIVHSLLSLLDMGLAHTINREVARYSAAGDIKDAGQLLHTLAVVYWSMAAAIALLLLVLAPLIAEYWIQSKELSVQTITHVVMLMGVVVACRWPIGLYQGALIGSQRLALSSSINMAMVTIGSAGSIAVLVYVSSTIEAFFIWQACVGLVYAAAMRFAAWRIIGKTEHNRFNIEKLRSVWRFSAGVSAIGLTGLIFTQMDKVILSKMLELEEFGHYMLATAVSSVLYVLITPVFNVIYPRFSALVASEDTVKLTELYRIGTRLLVSVVFPTAMVLAVFGYELVLAWTGNPNIASSVAPVVSLLAIGSGLHGSMFFPHALQLAYGMTWLPLTINMVLMIAFLPLTIYFALTYGALGGALAWLALHVMLVLLGTWLTHRHLLKGLGPVWLMQDIGIPLIVTLLIGVLGHFAVHSNEYQTLVKLLFGIMLALVAMGFSIATSKHLRDLIQTSLKCKKIGAI
jgi:O-antigen/teichoic acid export membrane protein